LKHDGVNAAGSLDRPSRRLLVKQGAFAPDIPAAKQGLAALERVRNFEDRNFASGPGQLKTAAHTLGRRH